MSFLRVLVCVSLHGVAAAREQVSFDFGWKHRTGLHTWAQPDDRPPVNPQPGAHPAEVKADYDDQDWLSVQLPHDGLISGAPSKKACPTGCSGNSFIPRHVLWYRKSFMLPEKWSDSAIWLDFDGSFRLTSVWINGEFAAYHDCGYTPFRLRLDNITSVKTGKKNTIAIFVDPDNGDQGARDHGSGWWYEGGGLYRHVHLTSANKVHIEQDGVFAYSNITLSTDGSHSAILHASAAVHNADSKHASACVDFSLVDAKGEAAAERVTATVSLASGASQTAKVSIPVKAPRLWTSSTPFLYTFKAAVFDGSCDSGTQIDEVEAPHGFRSLRYDANDGFFLNEEHFKVRGFCDHNTFAVVGMAVPERVNLFRAQASRAVGGNGRRTSHNPPDPSMLDIYDRVGIVVMDENRLFANNSKYVTNMGAMVKRDRNHPSVVIWSFCNEAGCEGSQEAGGPAFQAISSKYDGSRPTLANMFTFADLLSNTIDVQGFSHQTRAKLNRCHAKLPHKPIYMSECCSCNTMRDEDEGTETRRDDPHNAEVQKAFNARCTESNTATNASDGVNYAVGTMVWTLFDYYGEPPTGGPEVIGTFGQYDVCGFPKAAGFWYRTQWLLSIPDGPDKTFPTRGAYEVRIVESWESPDSFPSTRGNKTRAIHAYSNAPAIELFVNGKSQGVRAVTRMVHGPGSYAEWTAVPWEAGTIKAVARDGHGNAVASTQKKTNGKASSISLTIDAPSKLTGTGSSLFADGQDAALLRASIVDETGRVMHLATNNISFRVVSGPGVVQGTHNGDIHSQLSSSAPAHPAYHGLVRAVIRVTSVSARSPEERSLLQQIDVRGPMASDAEKAGEDADVIVVEASSPGFASATISIPVSSHPEDDVMAVAGTVAGTPVTFFEDEAGIEETNEETMITTIV